MKVNHNLAGALAVAVLFGASFAATFISAFQSPTPHRVPVAVVGPPPAVAQLRARINQQQPAAISLKVYPDETAARAALLNRDVDGALVLTTPGGSARLLVASAAGQGSGDLLSKAFTAAAASSHQRLEVRDEAPLPSHDRLGLTLFFLTISILIPSVIIGAVSSIAARSASRRAQAVLLTAGAVLLAVINVWIGDGLTGAIPGHSWVIMGVVILFSLAISSTTAALARFHPSGVALALLIFLFIGVPSTGGPAALARFLPSFFRAFTGLLPPGVAVRALNRIQYFNSHNIASSVWTLLGWVALGLGVLLPATLLTSRNQSPAPEVKHLSPAIGQPSETDG